ncbi:unnamed protein product, partial [Prorocentrum cordatum]
ASNLCLHECEEHIALAALPRPEAAAAAGPPPGSRRPPQGTEATRTRCTRRGWSGGCRRGWCSGLGQDAAEQAGAGCRRPAAGGTSDPWREEAEPSARAP